MTVAWPLFGHSRAEETFLSASQRGRLHHAWLIEGPKGIGKSILAQRLAAYMLGARGPATNILEADTSDPVVQKCMADGHPDLRILNRIVNDKGKLAQDISVEQVRGLSHFFSLKPAMGGWRVGIVDALDELNRNGANALLKTLEEPPDAAIIFLIYHQSREILPTIRSRCMRLSLDKLCEEDVLKALPESDNKQAVAKLAKGQPGLGQRLSGQPAQVATNAARSLVRAMPNPSKAMIDAAIQSSRAGGDAFEALCTVILNWIEDVSLDQPQYADTWLQVSSLLKEANGLKMEPAQTAAKMIAILKASSTKAVA